MTTERSFVAVLVVLGALFILSQISSAEFDSTGFIVASDGGSFAFLIVMVIVGGLWYHVTDSIRSVRKRIVRRRSAKPVRKRTVRRRSARKRR